MYRSAGRSNRWGCASPIGISGSRIGSSRPAKSCPCVIASLPPPQPWSEVFLRQRDIADLVDSAAPAHLAAADDVCPLHEPECGPGHLLGHQDRGSLVL